MRSSTGETDHQRCVRGFMDRHGKGLPPERLLAIFDQGFVLVWRRAHRALGEVTLTAITDRVLRDGAAVYPVLSALHLRGNELSTHDLHEIAGSLREDELAEALQCVLAGFLALLGTLTADILTPALHAELGGLGPDEATPGAPPNVESEDTEP